VSVTQYSRRFRRVLRREEAKVGRKLTFKEFVTAANPRYVWAKHHEIIAEAVDAVIAGSVENPVTGRPIRRLMVFVPPRHGKSELISRLAAAYQVYVDPDSWTALSSYGAELAYTLSKAARTNYLLNGGLLDRAMASVRQWQTDLGGGLWATGVGGAATGKGYRLGIIDDPVKNAEEASSAKRRSKLMDWYRSVWLTRQEQDPVEIIVQTRWNPDDLSGQLLEEERLECDSEDGEPDGWIVVNLPAVAEEAAPDEFPASCYVWPDWRQPGEALWPEKYPRWKLDRIRKRLGEYFWSALYQGRPRPAEGTFFKVSKIEFQRSAPPVGLRKVRAWDLAYTEGDGDYTVGVLLAGPDRDGRYHILDMVRFQHEPGERNRLIKLTVQLDGPTVLQVFPKDPAAGVIQAENIVRMLTGFNVKTIPIAKGQGKVLRATPGAAQLNGGNVSITTPVAQPWEKDFVEELRSFEGVHDDIVDAFSDAFNELAGVDLGGFATGGDRDAVRGI
jgi:predicted phage terminase large subunit-like protein